MTISPQDARKEILALFSETWLAKSSAIVSPAPEIRYQGFEKPELPGAGKFWVRVGTNTVTTRQRGHRLPSIDGLSGVVYTNYGFITLQIHAPMTDRVNWAKGELLAELGQCMFMAKETDSSIWFRNPRILELANDGTWYRWNVIADYQFDQTKQTFASPGSGPRGQFIFNDPVNSGLLVLFMEDF